LLLQPANASWGQRRDREARSSLPPQPVNATWVERQWPLALQLRDEEGMCIACQALSELTYASHTDSTQSLVLVSRVTKVMAQLQRLSNAVGRLLDACDVASGHSLVEELGVPVCSTFVRRKMAFVVKAALRAGELCLLASLVQINEHKGMNLSEENVETVSMFAKDGYQQGFLSDGIQATRKDNR
jgi:hypothetical protein